MTAHPDAFVAASPEERVTAFLDARAQDRMADPEIMQSYGRGGVVYELRVADLRALVMTAGVQEYRVETRRTELHPSGPGVWIPEGDRRTFPTREEADALLLERVRWYDAPAAWEHRVTVRTVTPWEVAP